MNKAIALAKGLVVSGAILVAALLIADCLECRSAKHVSVVAFCAILMAFMIGLQFWYLLGKFSRSIGLATEPEASKREGQEQLQGEMRVSKLTLANTVINLSILALAAMWIVGATFSLYPPFIPLVSLIVSVATVLLFGAAAGMSARVRAALTPPEAPDRWRWIAFSSVLATLIVIAVATYGLERLREHPWVGLICGALCLVATFCGVYRSGISEKEEA